VEFDHDLATAVKEALGIVILVSPGSAGAKIMIHEGTVD